MPQVLIREHLIMRLEDTEASIEMTLNINVGDVEKTDLLHERLPRAMEAFKAEMEGQ